MEAIGSQTSQHLRLVESVIQSLHASKLTSAIISKPDVERLDWQKLKNEWSQLWAKAMKGMAPTDQAILYLAALVEERMRHFTPASILSSKTLAKFTVNESQVADVLGKLVSLGFVNQRQTEYSFTIGPLRDWLISTSQDQGAFGGERVESVLLAGGSLDDLDLGYSDVVALESEVANSNQGDPTLKILDCEHLFESIVAIARLLTSELTTETLPELLRKILAFANCQTKGNWAFRDPRGEIALVLPSQTSRSDSVEAEHSVGVLPKS